MERTTVSAAAAPSTPGDSAAGLQRSSQYVSASWRAELMEPRMRLAYADDEPSPRASGRLIAAVLLGLCAILLILWLGWDRAAAPASGAAAVRELDGRPGASTSAGDVSWRWR